MKCPHDGTELSTRTYEAQIEVDECPKCNGMWLDKGELEQVQETIANDYRAELRGIPNSTVEAYKAARGRGPDDALKCPKCDDMLHQREHGYCSQIYIDVCQGCRGVWLNAGELQELEMFFERSQLETPKIRKSFWASLHDLVVHGIVPDE
jgi:Zn-finger nucleic acid-binding protein